jgi:hypothetical protein
MTKIDTRQTINDGNDEKNTRQTSGHGNNLKRHTANNLYMAVPDMKEYFNQKKWLPSVCTQQSSHFLIGLKPSPTDR